MGRGRFAGLSLLYIHSAKFTISPLSSSGSKLRLVLPYFCNQKSGTLSHTPNFPPPKPNAAPTNSINIHLALTQPGKPAEGEEVKNEDSMEVTYSDGEVLKVILEENPNGLAILQRVEKHARALRLKAEALQG